MTRLQAICLAITLLSATLVATLYIDRQPPLPIIDSLGGDFTLPSSSGKPVALQQLRGSVVLLNFGFTSCPDVCPTALSKMANSLKLLDSDAQGVQPLFITIDPQRDTLDKLGPYLQWFHPSIIGLRGDQQQLQTVAELYRVLHQKEQLDSQLGYGFIHNDHIYILDKQGRVRAMHSGSSSAEKIAIDIRRLL